MKFYKEPLKPVFTGTFTGRLSTREPNPSVLPSRGFVRDVVKSQPIEADYADTEFRALARLMGMYSESKK